MQQTQLDRLCTPEAAGAPRVPRLDIARARARALVARDAGAADALSALFRSHASGAVALARRITRCDQLAEDAVQEVFLERWQSPGCYDPAKGSVRAYLLTAVHHRAVDAVRREEVQHRHQNEQAAGDQTVKAPDVAEQVTDRTEHAARRAAVTAALATMPVEQRRVIMMMYFDAKTQQAIAAELEVPLGTVKSRALLAMRKLRAELIRPDPGRANQAPTGAAALRTIDPIRSLRTNRDGVNAQQVGAAASRAECPDPPPVY
ncbi:MAG: RNA polymerase sigma factor [Streptosporangiales bacterium]